MKSGETLSQSVAGIAAFGLILSLATYRIARLIANDKLLEDAQAWVFRRAYAQDGDSYVEKSMPWVWFYALITCPHCVGVWAAVPLGLIWWANSWAMLTMILIAAMGLQSFLASLASEE